MINFPGIDNEMYKFLKTYSKSELAKMVIDLNNEIMNLRRLNDSLFYALSKECPKHPGPEPFQIECKEV